MEIEIFVVCEFTQELDGKLNVIGTFNTISAMEFPATHPLLFIVGRLIFYEHEVGYHNFKIKLLDPSGENVVEPITGEIDVYEPIENMDSSIVNFTANMHQITFETIGKYTIELHMDDKCIRSTPIYTLRIES